MGNTSPRSLLKCESELCCIVKVLLITLAIYPCEVWPFILLASSVSSSGVMATLLKIVNECSY